MYGGSWSGWMAADPNVWTNSKAQSLADGQYLYRVYAQNSSGGSSWSGTSSTITVLRPPGAVGTPWHSPNPASNPYTVHWPAASGTVGYYEVQRSINSPSNFATYMTVGGPSFMYSSQPPGTTYYWRVRACNDTACSGWTASVAVHISSGGGWNPASDPDAPMGEPEPENGGEQ